MRTIPCLLLLLLVFTSSHANQNVLLADFRHRPPEMVLDGSTMSGPLKEILEVAAERIGYSVQWRAAHFARSIRDLEHGKIDIIPRMVRTREREVFSYYLGPIGFQKKDIFFLVRKGQENLINQYEDLQNLRIEVKRKTAYFDRFDNDISLNKRENIDDDNMVRMFLAQRFDTMPVLDRQSLEIAMEKHGITDYSYANYVHVNNMGNYYGLSKSSANSSSALHQKLNGSILEMVTTGEVGKIYSKYKLSPPHLE